MQVFRIVTRRRIAGAFSGEGARLYGGRWNRRGVPVVYTTASRALALLEMLVQDELLRAEYWVIPAEVPESVAIERVPLAKLPRNWTTPKHLEVLRAIGSAWAVGGKSAMLAVPSAVVPAETNYLLNPLHPDFKLIRIGKAQLLKTDLRLLRKFSAR